MTSELQQFDHLRIPLAHIKAATNNFSDENFIAQGGFGKVYKGQLLQRGQLIDIAIKRLDRKYGQGDPEFWLEVTMPTLLKQENLVSIVGFCDEDAEKIIITEYAVHGSLDIYLSLSYPTITWIQRLKICIGVSRALSYLHNDTGYSYDVIHRNIKSSKVLLDGNWEAKLCGFGISIKNPATRRHRLVVDGAGMMTTCYIDPIYWETGSVTHKSDVYSFGAVLFEVLCGTIAAITNFGDGYESIVPQAIHKYEEGKLDEMINPDLRAQMEPQSMTIFSETAYHCLKRQRTQRPAMEQVLKRLEKALELQLKHENPEHLNTPEIATSSNHLKVKKLAHLKIQLADIMLATEDFADKYCIGSGGYGMVYKAELDHFDMKSLPEEEETHNDELPKIRSSVAIKRIFKREDGQAEQGFFAEIEMLTSCKHPTVVPLFGFCDEGPELILVYEYASNGSLDNYLGSTDNMTILSWVQRIKMGLDIAHGLSYLHNVMEEKQRIIHRDIKSANILLGKNWEAKIADFGLSRFHPANLQASTLITYHIAGTEVYLDPEYLKTGKLKKESDIYSFGVVLFEIFCGRLANDEVFNFNNDKGLTYAARRFYKEGILKEMVDPTIKEGTDVNKFSLSQGPNQDSLDTYSKIAYQCLAETQAERPPMEVVIKELEKALYFQENHKDSLQISLDDIKSATQNFSDVNVIGRGGSGKVYKGEVKHANGRKIIAAKRMHYAFGPGGPGFLKELEILMEYKNENVIGFVGYCDEMHETIIVYEYAFNKSLDRHLRNIDLTWIKRLKICIDVASGLVFFHGGVATQEAVIHRDVKSSNILLTEDWKAKLTGFGHLLISPIDQEMDYVIKNAVRTNGYCDPLYYTSGLLTKESDIYSFGVVLFEILCGRQISEYKNDTGISTLTPLVKRCCEEGTLDEMVFEGIKEQIHPESFTTFQKIAYQCVHDERQYRPTARDILIQLKKALEFQEDYEIWESKLPTDYKEIIVMSKSPEIYSGKSKKDLYNMFSGGILLQGGRTWFLPGTNGKRTEIISARNFSYIKHCLHKWRSVPESRFHEVAEILDIMNLKIQIKSRTQLLSPDVVYGVYLVFKFSDSRGFSSKPMYVNLKYRKGNKILHAYFATWRDNDWMMIELFRFLNHNEDVIFQALLVSLSRYYCGDGSVYVEGIEFRAINDANLVKHEEIEKLNEVSHVLRSNSDVGQIHQLHTTSEEISIRSENYDEDEKLFWLTEVNGKKHLMLSAKAALYDFSNVKLFTSKLSSETRFQEVVEVLPHQVFRINCKIKSHMLSRETGYWCYLVFKLSEKYCGLNCPVKVRDLLHRNNKEFEVLYLRSPSPWNIHDFIHVPKQREDGWMEVKVWKLNANHEVKKDRINVNLKLISYEGTMAGLIVCGIEFRPM